MNESGTNQSGVIVDDVDSPLKLDWVVPDKQPDPHQPDDRQYNDVEIVVGEDTKPNTTGSDFLKASVLEGAGLEKKVLPVLKEATIKTRILIREIKLKPDESTNEKINQVLAEIRSTLPTEEAIANNPRDVEAYRRVLRLITEIEDLSRKKANLETEDAVNGAVVAQESAEGEQQVDLDQLPQAELDVDDIVPGPNGELLQKQPDGSAVVKTADGKEIKFNPGAVLAFLMIALLVDGDHTTRAIANQVANGLTDHVMINFLGIDPDKVRGLAGNVEVSEQYLFFLDKYQLKDFLEKMVWQGRRKVYTILENLPENTRQEFMQGKDVTRGGKTHKLDSELISKILAVLNQDDLVRLRLDKVVAQPKASS